MATIPQDEIDRQMAHINDDLSPTIIGVSTAFTAIGVTSFVLRLISRRLTRAYFSYDDYLALASVVSLIGLNISMALMAHYGSGRHLLYVLQDPSNIINIGKAQLGLEVSYAVCLLAAKTSILALYARIFTLRTRSMKIGVWSLSVVVVLSGVATILAIFLECTPLSTIWGVPVQCLPSKAESISVAVVGIVTDIAILALPQPIIWKLNRSFLNKLAISSVFLVGAFATLISIIRLPYLLGSLAGSSYDSTYSLTNGLIFTIIEPASVVLCGSMPMIPGLFAAWRKPSPKTHYVDRSSNQQASTGSSEAFQGTQSTNYYAKITSSEVHYHNRSESTEMFRLEPQHK